jgi:hypothetical protein
MIRSAVNATWAGVGLDLECFLLFFSVPACSGVNSMLIKRGGDMLQHRKLIWTVLAAMALLLAASPVLAVETTITGMVMDTFEIEAQDGTIYVIDETDTGFDLAAYAGTVMQVTGEVTEDGDIKVISVSSFKPAE